MQFSKRSTEEEIISLLVEKWREKEENNIISIKKLYEEFIEYKSLQVSSGTLKRMNADWKRFYEPYPDFISKNIYDVTKADCVYFLNIILRDFKIKQKAFNNARGILKQLFEYAVDDKGYLSVNPYKRKINKNKLVPSSKGIKETEVFLKNEIPLIKNEMRRRYHNRESNTAPLGILLDFEIGVREGELLALSEDDIVENTIWIHRELVEEWDNTNLNNPKSLGYHIVEHTLKAYMVIGLFP